MKSLVDEMMSVAIELVAKNEGETARELRDEYRASVADRSYSIGGDVRNAICLDMALGWYSCGFPRVVLGHKHAAALMMTKVPRGIRSSIPLPWECFVLDVPSGLVTVPEKWGWRDRECRYAIASLTADGAMYACATNVDGSGFRSILCSESMEDLATFDRDGDPVGVLIARLVLGSCVELMENKQAKAHSEKRSSPSIKRGPRGAPETMTFHLTAPVVVDVREYVRSICENAGAGTGKKRGSPSMQWYVQGYYRWQMCGKGRTELRRVLVPSHWNGKKDGPIAVRPHIIKSTEDVPE